jgi:DNA-binding response OmpR family regulator
VLSEAPCLLGRVAPCTVIVPRPTASRLHARITRDGSRYLLTDAGSVNGTYVNGRRLAAPHLLTDGDEIGLGDPAGLLRFADPDPTVVAGARLRLDQGEMRFYLGRTALELTPTQFRLLLHLYRNAGRLCTRESCAEAIWGQEYAPGLDADALDKAISGIRARARQADPRATVIVTRAGLGYSVEP